METGIHMYMYGLVGHKTLCLLCCMCLILVGKSRCWKFPNLHVHALCTYMYSTCTVYVVCLCLSCVVDGCHSFQPFVTHGELTILVLQVYVECTCICTVLCCTCKLMWLSYICCVKVCLEYFVCTCTTGGMSIWKLFSIEYFHVLQSLECKKAHEHARTAHVY